MHLIPNATWWIAAWCSGHISIDICTPPTFIDGERSYTDLELDPLAFSDGRVEIEGEDEFIVACEAGLISRDEGGTMPMPSYGTIRPCGLGQAGRGLELLVTPDQGAATYIDAITRLIQPTQKAERLISIVVTHEIATPVIAGDANLRNTQST